jgi:TIR domain-containing protein
MSGIFISYASEDREKAEMLAHALEQKGWPVWWDRQIPFGKSFDEVIEENLARAGCVLVLWTKVSVESRWVRSEASEAAARDVLIPVLFEPDVKIPLEFRLLQAVNLCDWRATAQHRAFDALVAQIADRLKSAGSADAQQAGARAGAETDVQRQAARRKQAVLDRGRATGRLAYFVVYVVAPSVLVVIAGFLLTSWRAPTRVQLDVAVDRIGLTFAAGEAVDLPERALNFRSLTVDNFDQASFTPKELAVGTQDSGGRMHYQALVTNKSKPAEIVLNGDAQTQPSMTLDAPAAGAGSAGRLEAIAVKPGSKVTLETAAGEAPSFHVRVEGQELSTNILRAGELLISAVNVTAAGLPAAARSTERVALRMRPSEDNPYLRIQGARRFFALSATLAERDALLLVGRARIEAIELLKQSADGSIQSALIAGGTIGYSDRRQSAPIALNPGDFVGLRNLQDASIVYLRLRADQAAMDLRLEGVAGQVERSAGGVKQDLRLTAFDALMHQARWVVLVAALTWMALVSFGVYRIYKGSRGTL